MYKKNISKLSWSLGISCCLLLFFTNSQAQQANDAFQQKINTMKVAPKTMPKAVQVPTPKINKEAFQKHQAQQIKMQGKQWSKAELKALYEQMLADPKRNEATKNKAQKALENLNK